VSTKSVKKKQRLPSPPNDFALQTQLLVQILEYILQGHPGEAVAGTACVGAYVQLSSLNYSKSIDRVLTSPSSGSLYELHLPANPEGFLSQLILGIVAHSDPKGLTELLPTLTRSLKDATINPRVKLHILNVENNLLRRLVVTGLPVERLSLGQEFCRIRRALVLDVMENPLHYFEFEDAVPNEAVIHELYGLYLDTERDIYLHVGQIDSVMQLYDDVLIEVRYRRQFLVRAIRSAIVANHRGGMLTAEALREKRDLFRKFLNDADIDQFDRMIDYHESGQDSIEIRDLTIELADRTFQGTELSQIYTLVQCVLPLELKEGIPECSKGGVSHIGRYQIILRRIGSVYDDPMMAFLANIGNEKIGGLPCNFLSDVNLESPASSTLLLLRFDGCVSLDFDVAGDGTIVEKTCEDEKVLRGGRFFPHKEEMVKLLRAIFREAPDQFPLRCGLEDLHVEAFSNYLVDYRLKSFGNFIVHQKHYLLTSPGAFEKARMRYAEKIGALYRRDERVGTKALLENAMIRTNESLRDFVYKALKLTVKHWIEQKACWKYLWKGLPQEPRPETDTHPFIDAGLRTILDLKGIRVSREPRMANGAVDFFCSFTTARNDVLKVCIEVKNAHGAGLKSGISKQLPVYMDGELTSHGIFLVMWYKGMDWSLPKEVNSVEELKTRLELLKPPGNYKIDLMVVDCTKPVSPSKM